MNTAALSPNYESITLKNDFMFGTVFRNPERCKPFLEIILGVRIAKIEYPEGQKTIDLSAKAKGIRLDVYVEDGEGTVYDVEMQTTLNSNLPKRSRYYQGMIDLNILNKGEDYSRLRKSLVIFICPFDPFGKGEYIYRFSNMCKLTDGTHIRLGDAAEKIFVNAAGTVGNVSGSFKNLMRFIMDDTANDEFTKKLMEDVAATRNNEKWRLDYMTLLMRDNQMREEGRVEGRVEGLVEGRVEGEEKMCRLLVSLYGDGRIDDAKLATKDKAARDRLYAEYGIS